MYTLEEHMIEHLCEKSSTLIIKTLKMILYIQIEIPLRAYKSRKKYVNYITFVVFVIWAFSCTFPSDKKCKHINMHE